MRIVTRNSVYAVKVHPGQHGFEVSRIASTWGARVIDRHYHVSPSLEVTIGAPMVTTVLRTSPVVAILPE